MDQHLEVIFKEGKKAFLGKVSKNPYKKDTIKFSEWLDGYEHQKSNAKVDVINMGCKRCGYTGFLELFSDEHPVNCKCDKGSKLEIDKLNKENSRMRRSIKNNNEKIAKLGLLYK